MTTIELLRRLPKVQLHCHLEGSLRAETFIELAALYGVSTVYEPGAPGAFAPALQAAAHEVYQFNDFNEFLLIFAAVCRSLRTPADYVRLLREYTEDARTHNVMYAELFVSPSVWRFFNPDLDLEETLYLLWCAAGDEATKGGPRIRFIVDLTRNFGAESAMEMARFAASFRGYGCVGIGLGGDEARFPPELFTDAFAYAREKGLHAVVHAGEAAGAKSIRNAIELLHAERIGHGIRAVEDPAVLELLIEKNIPLEVCPTSNFRTGVVLPDAVHPLKDLERAGVSIVLDSDDPAIFRTDVTAEYAFAEQLVGMDAVVRYARNAIGASFADARTKASMAERFDRESAELLALRRT